MNLKESYSIFPLGDSALLLSFGNVIDEAVNNRVLLASYLINSSPLRGITDVVPAYSSLSLHYDVAVVRSSHKTFNTAYSVLVDYLHRILPGEYDLLPFQPRIIKVPVCYGAEFGPDLCCLARFRQMKIEDVVQIHTSRRYRVYMIGFMPGFTYMAEVDERIQIRRRSDPRTRVEAGSVGIAGKQTGIYPIASPGGWQIIGRTPLSLFNNRNREPVLFEPGDEVEFYSISEDEYKDISARNS